MSGRVHAATVLASLFGSMVWGIALADDSMSLTLRPRLDTAASAVTLAQLVEISGDNEPVRRRVGQLELRLTSAPGQVERVSRDDVMALIALRSPQDLGVIAWNGTNRTCMVRLHGRPADVDALALQARSVLESWLQSRFDEFKVQRVENSSASPIELREDWMVRVRPFIGPISVRTAVWLDILRSDQSVVSSFPLWFQVEARAEVPVANRDIARDSRIDPSQVTRAVADLAALGARAVMSEDQLASSASIGPIKQGQVLTQDLFRQAPPVSAGDEVRVRVKEGQLRIEARGIALESGNQRQKVRVRNSGSGQVLVARVSGQDIVEVSP